MCYTCQMSIWMKDEETSQGRIHSKGREGQTDKHVQWGQGRDNPHVGMVFVTRLWILMGVDGCRRGNLEFSAIKFGAISRTALVNLYAPTYTPPPFHPLVRPHVPRTATALQETASWHPEGAAVPREASWVPSRWQWCLAQVVESANVLHGKRKLLSVQQTPHGSSLIPEAGPEVACRERKPKDPEYKLITENVGLPP